MLIIHMPKGIIKCRTNFLLDISIGASSRILCNQILRTYCGSDAISLFRRYNNVINRGGGDNLKIYLIKEFIGAGVSAYALGCTQEGLKRELTNMKESGIEIERTRSYRGNAS
ncbi:hypothetical protein MKX01_021690 [Papaver californicum]|nr:hypothetical protein MKX01_021690 [Papaver californicum]